MKNKYNYDAKLAKLQQDFYIYYQKNLRQDFKKLEQERYKYLAWFILCCTILFAVHAVLYYVLGRSDFIECITSKAGFCGVAIGVWLCTVPISKYKGATKSLVADKILKFWTDFHENKANILASNDIKNSELFDTFNDYEKDDEFAGKYKDNDVCISEYNLNYRRQKSDVTLFDGIFIWIKLKKKVSCRTILRSNKVILPGGLTGNIYVVLNCCVLLFLMGLMIYMQTMFGRPFEIDVVTLFFNYAVFAVMPILLIYILYRIFIKTQLKSSLKHSINLEDIDFEKKWKVYSQDQIEARCLLNPKFMEQLKNVQKYFHGKKIDCSFWKNNLLIAIHTNEDMFETTSLFSSALSYKNMRKVVTQFYSVFAIIEELNEK